LAVLEEKRRVAFGRFEADLRTGEIWKGAIRIHLATQPFKVLRTLIENAGNVVTKEELQRRLWDKDTNVDFERAIAGSINKLRDALGDSAEEPRYIETLPKRGYRFVAKVTVVEQEPIIEVSEHISPPNDDNIIAMRSERTVAGLFSPGPTVTPTQTVLVTTGSSSIRRIFLGAALAIAAAEAAALVWMAFTPAPHQPEVRQLTYDSPISAGPPNPGNLPVLTTDGAFLYGTARIDGKPTLAAISMETGHIERLAVAQEFSTASVLDISKTGGRLLVMLRKGSSVEQPLWVLPTSGGAALRVANIMAHAAAWMPDGTSVLYANGNDLWTVRLTDGVSTLLLTLPGSAFWPRWSPDGSVLRFTLVDPNTHASSISEMRNGKQTAQSVKGIAEMNSQVCCGSWSASGKSYVFQEFREKGIDLWEATTGAFVRERVNRLTYGPERYFSPLTDRLTNRIYFLGIDELTEIQRFERSRRTFVPGPSFLRNAVRVEYSPDGKTVAWTDADGSLWQASATDGSNHLQLAPPGYEVFAAHWSPDGTQLALMARRPGRPWGIYLESANGGQITELLREDQNIADPSWSPDGKSLVYGREPDMMGKDEGPRQLYLLDIASKKSDPLNESSGLFSPRWSPDGKWIAALSLDQHRVMLYNVQARTWSLLSDSSGADPVWSRDSNSLYVHAFLAENQPIMRLSVPTGAKEKVADLNDLSSSKAENYFFSGLTHDDEPLILPRVGTSNLYTLDLNGR
jgi:Tol biopolymer transport system component/DNA-binding winged helix-turn-helix (wHTH) protein